MVMIMENIIICIINKIISILMRVNFFCLRRIISCNFFGIVNLNSLIIWIYGVFF